MTSPPLVARRFFGFYSAGTTLATYLVAFQRAARRRRHEMRAVPFHLKTKL